LIVEQFVAANGMPVASGVHAPWTMSVRVSITPVIPENPDHEKLMFVDEDSEHTVIVGFHNTVASPPNVEPQPVVQGR
jgi:hypothetical protein